MKERKKTIMIFVGIIFSMLVVPQVFIFSGSAVSSTYYISTIGNDNNPGTSTRPWRNIQKAANSVSAGDTVIVRNGTYNELITISNKQGSANGWITFKTEYSWGAIIDGTGKTVTDLDGLVTITDSTYIRVSGFKIQNSNAHGIMTHGQLCHDHILDHNYLYNTYDAAISWVNIDIGCFINNITIEYNTIIYCNVGGMSGGGEAISCERLNNYLVQYNHIEQCGKECMNGLECHNGIYRYNWINGSHYFTSHPDDEKGIMIDGYTYGSSDIEIYNNYIEGRCNGISIEGEYGGSLNNIKIYNNIINLKGDGISGYYGICTADPDAMKSNIYIFNNDIICKQNYVSPIAIQDSESVHQNIQIMNNIMVGETYYIFVLYKINSNSPVIIRKSNLYYNPIGTTRAFAADNDGNAFESTAVKANPLFVNSLSDWHLQSNSPAIDKGTTVSSTDYDGNTRPQGPGFDIGAYEYVVSGSALDISSVTIKTSPILDTDANFGWENITCIVTSSFMVNNVFLILARPNGAIFNTSMSKTIGSGLYYYNTSFPLYGNYIYSIWACDTDNDGQASNSYVFSMPPNWDINNDGQCKIIDYVFISIQYGKTGRPGWIREDVDNNGVINILDLSLISNHYGE